MSNHHDAGKGDTRRPQTVSDEKYKQNYNDIFNSKGIDNAKEAGKVYQESKETEEGC